MKYIDFEPIKETLLNDYLISKNLIQTAKKYSLDKRTVKKFLIQNGIKIKQRTILTEATEQEIIKLYQEDSNITKIKNIYQVGHRKIVGILNKYEIPLIGNRVYDYNENFFEEINTSEKAYWLGFIYADGGLYTDGYKCHQLFIKLCRKDESHLEKFKESLNSNYIIKQGMDKGFGKIFPTSKIVITSKKMFNDLCKHGCMPNKTFKLKFPQWLPPHLISHFIRGYFDGDGSISICKESGVKQFNIIGNLDMLTNIQNHLVIGCLINKTKIGKKNNVYSLNYGGNLNIEKIKKYLYKDANIFLDRKEFIFKQKERH